MSKYLGGLFDLATPKNITYYWGFGRFLGSVIVIQVVSGFFLAFYYTSGTLAWESVVDISREVSIGWICRLVHSNTASFVFIVLFLHIFRGIFYGSFYLILPWVRGWGIMLFTIMAAFLGYVLPWGQMSFWGATVIINLLRVLPIGKTLVIWLWGGFYVSSFTCSFFYAVHFLVPLVVLAMAGVHLLLLHFTGSSVPGGLRFRHSLKTKFNYYFTYKDLINRRIFLLILILMLALPDWSADPVNFIASDLSSSPLHIQPEWYFLHLYAVLRSIPNKLGGLVGFFLALAVLLLLPIVIANQRVSQTRWYIGLFWFFVVSNVILIWLGIQPVEEPYIIIGQRLTVIYFSLLTVLIISDILMFYYIWRFSQIANLNNKYLLREWCISTTNFQIERYPLQQLLLGLQSLHATL